MDDDVARTARLAARQLAAELGDQLPGDVEAALHARDGDGRLERYVDAISLAGLVVSVASLAWTVYRDLKSSANGSPGRDVVERHVRVEVRQTDAGAQAQQRDRIIEVVVAEIMRAPKP